MNNRKRTWIIAAISLSALLAIGFVGLLSSYNNKPVSKARKIVSEMDIDERIGQILMLSFRTWKNDAASEETQNITVLNDEIRSVICDYHLGGIALLQRIVPTQSSLFG